jgi:hypothetical protein
MDSADAYSEASHLTLGPISLLRLTIRETKSPVGLRAQDEPSKRPGLVFPGHAHLMQLGRLSAHGDVPRHTGAGERAAMRFE